MDNNDEFNFSMDYYTEEEKEAMKKTEQKKKEVLEKIKGNTYTQEELDYLTIDDLLSLDNEGISYLEYICESIEFDDIPFSYALQKEILRSKDAIYICAKCDTLFWINNIEDEDVFFEKVDGDISLIQYIFDKNVCAGSLISLFEKRYEIIDYLIEYDKNSLDKISEKLIQNIFENRNGNFIIDKYIYNKKIIAELTDKASITTMLNYCREKNSYEIMKCCKKDRFKEKDLLSYIGNGEILLDLLLKLDINPFFENYDFKSKKIIDTLIKHDRIDLMYNAHVSLLLDNYDSNNSYFDLMIMEYKKGKNVNFERLSFNYKKCSSLETAKELIVMAKNNLIGYVPKIDSKMLLYRSSNDKKSVIEWLINLDKNLTINVILEACYNKKDEALGIMLKSLGIDDVLIDIKATETQFSDEYINTYNSTYANDYEENCKELINELRELFYQDGKSDKGIVDCLILSYKYLLFSNELLAKKEIKQLIEIKKAFPNKFVYLKSSSKSYFSTDGIFINGNIINTINHETSHALHYYLTQKAIPTKYSDVVERVRNNPSIILKVKEYSVKYNKLRQQLLDSISKSKISDYYDSKYNSESILDLAKFLALIKEEKREEFENEYPEQVLDTILAKTYSIDEYINQRKEIEIYEVFAAVLKSEYGAFAAIGDIIDAVFLGKLKNGVLMDENGDFIDKTSGHGIKYYSTLSHGFNEMIADYGQIIKSKNGDEMIIYLRSIVGDEMVDMIKGFYEKRILDSTKFTTNISTEEGLNYDRKI